MNLSRRNFIVGIGATTAGLALAARLRPAMAANESLPPLVFIPGIKGSVLSDAQGAVHWFNLWQGLGIEAGELSLPIQWRGQTQEKDGLVATAPLSSVGWHGVYAPFLNWAAESGRIFRAFAYDWRRDNLETTDEFVAFLEKVSAERGGAKVQVVAHSMGGLVSLVALNRRPDLFHSVLFAGVPFGSGISFLEDMHAGISNGLNKRILSPQVLFTFASPYTFFSANPKDSGLVDIHGTNITHDWFSADDWARQKLGIFANSGPEGVTPAQREHLRRALDQARQFRSLLAYKDSVSYPPIAVLAADAHPTLGAVVRDGPRAVKGWDFISAPKKQGDERVDIERSAPPTGVVYRVFKSSRAHEDLLNDTAQVEGILAQLSAR